uniref:Protein BFR2 n=1 Tax=Caenorhabditis tropicalis TaxID=1561998 RepID=A0A1I7T0V0_9PELO
MGLLDDISKLTTPASELPDLEDDNFEGSSLVKAGGNRPKTKSNFNFEEGKYAGSAVSRKDIFGDVSEISGLHGKGDESDDSVEDEDEELEENEDEEEEEEEDVEMEEAKKGTESSEENSDDDAEDEEISDEEEDQEDGEEEESSAIKMTTLSLKDNSDKTDKATSVLHQRQVWDDLMYSNIRMHALLNAMNQMPRGESRKNLLKNCDGATKKSLENSMENMAKLRDLMKNAMGFFDEKKREDSDDEEIPSDDEEISSDFDEENDEEDDDEGSDDEEDHNAEANKNSGTSLKSLKKNLETLDTNIDKFRTSTVTKWYNRTKILSSKSINNADFSGFEKGSVIGQVNKVLADEDKLLKKVHTNRSGKTRIGEPADVTNIDNELFDDSDFYQILLKQMLESRNQTNTMDGADMTRSYMELQSMFSNKKKRDVSQLSSKDRRLKYEPIAKLINFYPSKPSVVTWTHESRNELFKSLFS